jgi:hypothetical protein
VKAIKTFFSKTLTDSKLIFSQDEQSFYFRNFSDHANILFCKKKYFLSPLQLQQTRKLQVTGLSHLVIIVEPG